MHTKYKHHFDRVIFNNRWRMRPISRPEDWVFIGVSVRWFSPSEYEYVISFFGFDVRIWMKRTFIGGKNNQTK